MSNRKLSPSYLSASKFKLVLVNGVVRELRIDWYGDMCIDALSVTWKNVAEQRKYIEWYITSLCEMGLVANYEAYESEKLAHKVLMVMVRDLSWEQQKEVLHSE